jgi:predicted ATP-dependent endonuclease of OLD family
MKISQIKIANYRLLKDFSIQLEKILSLAIGKNNCGKTSLLSLLEKFLLSKDSPKFSFDDLNIERQQELKAKVENIDDNELTERFGISLKLYIDYTETDNLANISSLMLDLDPDYRTVILSFEYTLDKLHYLKLRTDFAEYKAKMLTDLDTKFREEEIAEAKQKTFIAEAIKKKDILYFLKKYHANYFIPKTYALEFNNEINSIDLLKDQVKIDRILNFRRIKAKRDVTNEDGVTKKSDKTLSKMSSKYYDRISNADVEGESIRKLQNELSDTDDKLNLVYTDLFSSVIEKVKKFGGIKEDESKLMIISSLEEKNLLSNNTTVMYRHGAEHSLPEDYNGLGYMNLIAMIFEIEVVINDFKKKKMKDEQPADINLFFIEEPEAHTHPQMQYVFIKNIKSILEQASKGIDDGIELNLQTIITTHSSCITAESDFDDIKYFHRAHPNRVIVKNLKDLQTEYAENDPKDYQFLKQYLTLNRTELFFADKAIFIEGDTERLLLPAMMKKIDAADAAHSLPLLSQNISMVEVGAYSHIFEKFLDFLGIRTLIVTDLDSIDENRNKCRVEKGTNSSNSALNFFYGGKTLEALKDMPSQAKKLAKKVKDDGARGWETDEDGGLCIVYQEKESNYYARSFEDAFIHLNLPFLRKNKEKFKSLKNVNDFDNIEFDAYHLADNCIDKKTLFALDILFTSDPDFSNWEIPSYIKNGLEWLKN